MNVKRFLTKAIDENKGYYICWIWLNNSILVTGKCEDVYFNLSATIDNVIIDSGKIIDNDRNIDIHLDIDSFKEHYKLI